MPSTITINHRLVRLTGAVLAGGTLLAIAYIAGAHPGPPVTGVIHSCVSNPSPGGPNIGSPGSQPGGTIRIVGATTACNATETAMDWNAQGIQGPPGPRGPSGFAGTQVRSKLLAWGTESSAEDSVFCLTGEVATGGGYWIRSAGFTLLESISSAPQGSNPPTGWRFRAFNPSDDLGGQVDIYVICAPV